MAGKRGPIAKMIDAIKDGVSDVLDSISPEPERIPIPVRKDDRGFRR
ncbi:hypothetical protein jaqu_17290 [Jannaschia aquimarina]|uniref:Uncharacterized protein n=1 Tax=Jannaschia aquimarina TaxID=935700 RepID=A0A0D1EHY3_9RHOB|nr:hypothetical protein jaqu_17290 [Jannaschia aquimarina]SNT07060.1 hypothetical protein SAMN05421775_105116 [Jannaschia aquimarina]